MPPKAPPRESPTDARKKPRLGLKRAEREARLAEALRENLRRRKAKPAIKGEKDE